MALQATRLAWGRLSCRMMEAESTILRAGHVQCRSFADQAGSSGKDGEAKDSELARSSAEDRFADLDPTQEYSKAQLAHYAPDPEKHKRFLPRLSRKERGSYALPEVEEEFLEEAQAYPRIPSNVPLYNLSDVVAEIYEMRSDLLTHVVAAKDRMPDKSIAEVIDALGLVPEEAPAPTGRPILQWESTLVLATGVNASHPSNWKARCRVYLRDLQREAGLSEEAARHIARIAGSRYSPGTGRLLLTCDRHADRETNRSVILQQIHDLVEEGKRAFPLEQAQATAEQ